MGTLADDERIASEFSDLLSGEVVLADVDTVGAGSNGDVGAVVYDADDV